MTRTAERRSHHPDKPNMSLSLTYLAAWDSYASIGAVAPAEQPARIDG